ncbi:MAG: hypothetical protein C5B49_03285 [Bdellovibrio sp.]|nr:MAG: hypothetical protein C5B49_03285 [Bdellovibrio sp.]
MSFIESGTKLQSREKRSFPLKVPNDLTLALRANPKALATFNSFTPTRQKDYIYWINGEGDHTRLFTHRADVESFNLECLGRIKHPLHSFNTEYSGKESDIENFKKHAPIPGVIQLKKDALVMLRQNDMEGRWVNGSLGRVIKITDRRLEIQLDEGGTVDVEKEEFTLLNADGAPIAAAKNFPVSLAWAITIHKAQGTTLSKMSVDLSKAWEPGQAYVALSRVGGPGGLFVENWSKSAIFADPQVMHFHRSLVARRQ